jgi:uncharacterized protein YlxW (UPF0749 family)
MRIRPSGRSSGAVNVAIIGASVILGFLLTVQFRSAATHLPAREQSRLATVASVERLEQEQRELKDQIAQLRAQIAAAQRASDAVTADTLVSANIDQQRLLAGLIPVRGQGIIVTLDDSTRTVGAADDANNFIIHDYELRDVVSLMWLASAEAVSINEERLVNVSSIYCVGSTILVNDTRLSPPYEVRAVGDPAVLEQALQNPKNLAKLRARVKSYGIQFKVAPAKDVVTLAYSGKLNIRYARPDVETDRNSGPKPREMR